MRPNADRLKHYLSTYEVHRERLNVNKLIPTPTDSLAHGALKISFTYLLAYHLWHN
jgi:hypothetical protein